MTAELRPFLLADLMALAPTGRTLNDMNYMEFGYMHVRSIYAVTSIGAPSASARLMVDSRSPVYPHECNWQRKPGLVGVYRVLDGYQVCTYHSSGQELGEIGSADLKWVHGLVPGSIQDQHLKPLLVPKGE